MGSPSYIKASKSMRHIARHGAELLAQNIVSGSLPVEKIYFMGHSLGAHMMSFAAKDIFEITGKKVGRITALDPAGPLFNACASKYRIDASDAQFVDTVHTDSGYFPYQGMVKSVSDADFKVNGGSGQPGCSDHSCNHFYATRVWRKSLFDVCPLCPVIGNCSDKNYFGFYAVPTKNPTEFNLETAVTASGSLKFICDAKSNK